MISIIATIAKKESIRRSERVVAGFQRAQRTARAPTDQQHECLAHNTVAQGERIKVVTPCTGAYRHSINVMPFADGALPAIKKLTVEIHSMGEGFERTDLYPLVELPHYHQRCRNPRCRGGGFDLGEMVYWRLNGSRSTKSELSFACSGFQELSGQMEDCDAQFELKITAEYNDVPSEEAALV